MNDLRILMTQQHPAAVGSIPKVTRLMKLGLEELGCQVTALPYGRWRKEQDENLARKAFERTADLRRIAGEARRASYDVFFSNTDQDWLGFARDVPLFAAISRLGLPIVMLIHGSQAARLAQPEQKLFRLLAGAVVRQSRYVFLLSAEEVPIHRQHWPGVGYRVVPLPFDIAGCPAVRPELPAHWQVVLSGQSPLTDHLCGVSGKAAQPHQGEPLLLFVGRLVPEKGVLDLLAALERVLARTPCRLAILGEGELRPQLEAIIAANGLADRVLLAGYVGDEPALRGWYQAADALILPTYHAEGFPVVVLEAAAAGLPVICTRIRAMADRLQEGVNALFVEARDPALLAEAMLRLLSEPGLRERMGAENRRWVEQFAPRTVMRDYLQVFREVCRH